MVSVILHHFHTGCKLCVHLLPLVCRGLTMVYRYCVVGIGIIVGSITYWALWYEILPWAFRYRLVPEKRVLDDGTHVTVVSIILSSIPKHETELISSQLKREKIN